MTFPLMGDFSAVWPMGGRQMSGAECQLRTGQDAPVTECREDL